MNTFAHLLAVTAEPGAAAPVPPDDVFGPSTCVDIIDGVRLWRLPLGDTSPGHAGPNSTGRAATGGTGGSAGTEPFALSLGAPAGPGLMQALRTGTGLAQLPAPFAVAAFDLDPGAPALVGAIDHAGLRHHYVTHGEGWAAVSTSALVLARLIGVELDEDALGAYRLIGHHLGIATPFRRVGLVPAGHRWRLAGGVCAVTPYQTVIPNQELPDAAPSADPVAQAAGLLRSTLEFQLDAHPDVVLELSGGLDSRLLLAALPPHRRKGLRAFTLVAEGSRDHPVAVDLAGRYELDHRVVDLDGLRSLGPEQAYQLVHGAAVRHDTCANPVAQGVLDWVEAQAPAGPRLNGQGGEFARGFYYPGQRDHHVVTPALVDRLARWRLFTNDAVSVDCLVPDFAAHTEQRTLAMLQTTLAGYAVPWLAATDEFYLRERLRRWVGSNVTRACLQRVVLSPFFGQGYLALSRSLPAQAKRGSRFTAAVLAELAPELARVRLADGWRPSHLLAPVSLVTAGQFGGKAARKLSQRLKGRGRPAAGAAVLADLVVRHWRANPHLMAPIANGRILRPQWVEEVVSGAHEPDPATVGFMVNIAAALE